MRARARGINFISNYNQNIRKGEFFMLVRVRFEKQGSKIRKKWKANIWSLDLDQKMDFY